MIRHHFYSQGFRHLTDSTVRAIQLCKHCIDRCNRSEEIREQAFGQLCCFSPIKKSIRSNIIQQQSRFISPKGLPWNILMSHFPFIGYALAKALIKCNIRLTVSQSTQRDSKALYLGGSKVLAQTPGYIPDQSPIDDLFPFMEGQGG